MLQISGRNVTGNLLKAVLKPVPFTSSYSDGELHYYISEWCHRGCSWQPSCALLLSEAVDVFHRECGSDGTPRLYISPVDVYRCVESLRTISRLRISVTKWLKYRGCLGICRHIDAWSVVQCGDDISVSSSLLSLAFNIFCASYWIVLLLSHIFPVVRLWIVVGLLALG